MYNKSAKDVYTNKWLIYSLFLKMAYNITRETKKMKESLSEKELNTIDAHLLTG